METTKLIVEYLVVGILVCLSIIFLVFNILPDEVQSLWLEITQYSTLVGAGVVAMLLPIAYGIGMVVEYLGMLLYERRFDAVKENRFSIYAQQNLDWLTKERLFKNLVKKDQPIPKGTGLKLYGEMRFFILMNSAYLYGEVERHLNQVRILRPLTIAEIFFASGFVVQMMTGVKFVSGLIGLIVMILLIISNAGAINHRFHHYCRAIERSYKALKLEEMKNPVRN